MSDTGSTEPGSTEPGTSATEADEAPAEEPTEEPSAPRRGRSVPVGAFALAVLVAAALAVLAVVALTTGGDGGDDDQEIRLAAGSFAEEFLTFEHDALDEWKEGVLERATSGFAEEVEEVESGLRALISESELDAVTQVTEIFVGQEERGSVDVVVVYDRELRGGELSRTETDRYLQMRLVRIEDRWLVDNVIDIASAGADGDVGGAVAPETTSTTAPAAGGGG